MALTQANCCRILGVAHTAPIEEIRRAYRKLARRLHPDLNPGDARISEQFKEITAAYNFLVGLAEGGQGAGEGRASTPRADSRAAPRRPAPRPRSRASEASASSHARTRKDDPEAEARAEEARARRDRDHAAAWAEWRRRASAARTAWGFEEGQRPTPRPATEERAPATDKKAGPRRYADITEDLVADEEVDPAAESVEIQPDGDAQAAEDAAEAQAAAEPREDDTITVEPRAEEVEGGFFKRLRAGIKGRAAKTTARPVRLAGKDVTIRLPVDARTVVEGGSRRIAVTRNAACPSCSAGGDASCICSGLGRVKVKEKVKVTIPAGARHGARLRLAGKGTAGLAGRADGDLFLQLEPEPIAGYRREEADLHGFIDVPRRILREGGKLKVPTPTAKVTVRVPAGTTVGARFRLSGQGLARWGAPGRGDLYLVVAGH